MMSRRMDGECENPGKRERPRQWTRTPAEDLPVARRGETDSILACMLRLCPNTMSYLRKVCLLKANGQGRDSEFSGVGDWWMGNCSGCSECLELAEERAT
jgi:hypothetical protein